MTEFGARENYEVEGFGRSWDHITDMKPTEYYKASNFSGVLYNQSQTVLFKPLLGIFNQPKYLPIRYSPLTIEIELVNDMLEPIAPQGNPASEFSVYNTRNMWQIQNVQLKCDLVALASGLENSYAQHLLSGKS